MTITVMKHNNDHNNDNANHNDNESNNDEHNDNNNDNMPQAQVERPAVTVTWRRIMITMMIIAITRVYIHI